MLVERWEAFADMPDFSGSVQTADATGEVVNRMAEKMKERLNRELEGEPYFVSRVSIRFTQEQDAETGTLLPEIEIRIKERTGKEESGRIGIEEIVIGQPREPEQDGVLLFYRKRFAAVLEMEEESVEVRRDGRG